MQNMNEVLSAFWRTFIPIFVAIDVLGVLPLYVGMVADKENEEKRSIPLQATLTAFIVATVFILVGDAVFAVMGITLSDFRIAGGILLFILATGELAGTSTERRRNAGGEVGIFPIGIPLIIGPAALATLLLQYKAHGLVTTLVALSANMLIVWVCLAYSDLLLRLLGKSGARAFAKVANLLLASIGVMMVRRGLQELGLVQGHP